MKYFNILIFALTLFVGIPSARSEFEIYTDRSAFYAASQDLQVIDFNDEPAGFYGQQFSADGVTFVSQTYIGYPNGNLYIMSIRDYSPSWYQVLYNYDVSLPLRILLPPGTTAFGANFSTTTELALPQTPDPYIATITLADGTSYTFNANKWPDLTFWGFTSDTPVASLTYSDSGAFYGIHYEVMDNVAFGSTAVPEPAPVSLALLAGGVIAVSRVTRRVRL
jgi:hypothetical protein